jgi:Flp pilus assembly protein TadG
MARGGKQGENGQALVELTLALPVLLLILFGIIQFGSLYDHYESLTNATRAGARVAAVSRSASNPVSTTVQAVKSAAPNLNASQLVVTVSGTWTPGATVTVTATYPYSVSLGGIVVHSGTLTSTTTERVE